MKGCFGKTMAIGLLLAIVVVTAGDVRAMGSGEKSPEEEAAEKVQKATKKYNEGVQKMERAKAYWAEGDTAKARKEFEKAADRYSQAIDLYPDFPEALSNLGYSLRVTGRFDEALRHYDRAIELKPDFMQAHEYRARAYLALDRVKDATDEYEWLMNAGYEEEAARLKEAIDAWVLAKAEGRTISVEKGAGW